MATTSGNFRVRKDDKIDDLSLVGSIDVSGQPKFLNTLAVQTATAVDVSATLYVDMAAGLAAFGASTLRLAAVSKMTKLLVNYQTTTANNNGNVTVSVRNTDGTTAAATSVLHGTSSTATVGASSPLYGTITFTFDRPVPAGTAFTVALTGTVSNARTWFLTVVSETN